MEEKYYTPEEVAELLKVTRRSVYTWIKEDKIAAVKVGTAWRIPESALDRITAFGNMSHLKRIAESLNLTIESKQDNKTRLKGYRLLNDYNQVVAGEDYSLSVDELAEALADYRVARQEALDTFAEALSPYPELLDQINAKKK